MVKDRFKTKRPKTKLSCSDLRRFFISTFPGDASCVHSLGNVDITKDMINIDNELGVWSSDLSKSYDGKPHNRYLSCKFDSNLNLIDVFEYDGDILFSREKGFNMFVGRVVDKKLFLQKDS